MSQPPGSTPEPSVPPSNPFEPQAQPPSNPYEPHGPPQAPYGGYQQQPYGYGTPPPPPPPKKSRKTGWIVLGVILGAVVLICGGCLAVGAMVFDKGKDAVEEAVERMEPRAIDPGESLTVEDVTIQAGWKPVVKRDQAKIKGLVISRADTGGLLNSIPTVNATFTFYDGATLLATVQCVGEVPKNETQPLECSPSSSDARAFDRLTVSIF